MNAKGNGFAPRVCDVAGLAVIFVMRNRIPGGRQKEHRLIAARRWICYPLVLAAFKSFGSIQTEIYVPTARRKSATSHREKNFSATAKDILDRPVARSRNTTGISHTRKSGPP